MNFVNFCLIATTVWSLASCGDKATVTSEAKKDPVPLRPDMCTSLTAVAPTLSDSNVMAVSVNGSSCSAGSYYNKPCVSVKICAPGSTTNCQVINDLLLDTGSVGLRVFKSVLNSSVSSALTPVTVSKKAVGECAQFFDGSSMWGAVQTADLYMGNETVAQTAIQVLDTAFGTTTANKICAGNETQKGSDDWPALSPDADGLNGILGVGLLESDCGDLCVNNAANRSYFMCASNKCSGTKVPAANQLLNPVTLLGESDNNGVILELPTVAAGGALSVEGLMVFGVGTRPNNLACSAKLYTADSDTGEFSVSISGHNNATSFIDSGSNSWAFPAANTSFPNCKITDKDFADYFCPASLSPLAGTATGSSSTTAIPFTLQIGNAVTLLNGANYVFGEIGADSGDSTTADLGLPFFLGRNVYLGFEGKSSSLGTGTYWAY